MATDADSNPWDIRAGESAFAFLDRIQVLDAAGRPRVGKAPPGAQRPEPYRAPRRPPPRAVPAPEHKQSQPGPPGTVSRELLQRLLKERRSWSPG
jgi:hypothetical protein